MQIRLPPELIAFVAANSGEGTHFSSADEFIAAVLQEKRERLEIVSYEVNRLDSGDFSHYPTAAVNGASDSVTAARRTVWLNAAD
jgi:hypothetical protein